LYRDSFYLTVPKYRLFPFQVEQKPRRDHCWEWWTLHHF
jgi:hypothetical protein